MTIPCPNCGRLNRPGARYCASCQMPLGGAPPDLQTGQLLGGGAYRVVRPLGKGGMGAVWLVAQTRAFDRLAVLKEVIEYFDTADVQERQKALDRFEAEARTLGELKHPGIPDLYAYFSEGGHNYLVMEYIEGPDLSQGLTREDGTGQIAAGGPRPADEVLRYTSQICEVLEYLAGRQPPVVHNDIKPGNIIIDQHSQRAVLVDFGTAKTRYLRSAGRADGSGEELYGTVGYAAPELFRGHAEPRSDVYSLAATAYHLLTDDDPRDHPMQYPQLDRLPPAVAEILRAALAQEIKRRPTAAEFRQQLEAYLAGGTGPLRALTFPGSETATSRDQMLTLAAKHWSYAAGLLQDGTLARWALRTLHDSAAARAAEEAVKRWPQDADAALAAFIQQLSPALLPPPKMELRTATLYLGEVGQGQRIAQRIEFANRGRGLLQGEVLSAQPWVKVGKQKADKDTFSCPPGQTCVLPVEIDTTGLKPGQIYSAAITLAPTAGLPEVVPIEIAISLPAIQVAPTEVDFGTVSRGDLGTPRLGVTVSNISRAVARCRVVGAPEWLLVKPEAFALQPGERQDVEMVGRLDRVPGRRQKVAVMIALEGGQGQAVDVSLQIRGGIFG